MPNQRNKEKRMIGAFMYKVNQKRLKSSALKHNVAMSDIMKVLTIHYLQMDEDDQREMLKHYSYVWEGKRKVV